MPVIEISYQRLCKLIGSTSKQIRGEGTTPTKEIISQTLPFLGLDIESEDNDSVRIEYSPNRPDYSTDIGISLGMQGLLNIQTGAVTPKIVDNNRYIITIDDTVSHIRPFVTMIMAKNGSLDGHAIKQMMAMQEDLHFGIGRNRKKAAIGMHDADKIRFPLIYTTVSRDHQFVPLHTNGKQMSISQMLNTTKTGIQYSHLIASSPDKAQVILDADGKTVSVPPIINADITALTTKTRDILVDITGNSREDIEEVLAVVSITLQAAGFSLETVHISGEATNNRTPTLSSKSMMIPASLVNKRLGVEMTPHEIVLALQRARLDARICVGSNEDINNGEANSKKDRCMIQCDIPPHRFDIVGSMDVVEEAALGYGIYNLEPTLPPSLVIGQGSKVASKYRSINLAMIGLGYTEALNSSLTSPRVLYKMAGRQQQQQQQQQPPTDNNNKMISVLDPKSGEHAILRDCILPELLENISRNIHEPYPQHLFETGSIFVINDNKVTEKTNLAVISAHHNANYSYIKSIMQSALSTACNITDLKTIGTQNHIFEDGHCADIVLDGKIIGNIGEINHTVVTNNRIRVPIVGFEVTLSDFV